jgi:hypothetical protein
LGEIGYIKQRRFRDAVEKHVGGSKGIRISIALLDRLFASRRAGSRRLVLDYKEWLLAPVVAVQDDVCVITGNAPWDGNF